METAALASIALLAIRGQRLGLILPQPTAWRDLYGLRSARLELPATPHASGADPQEEALALSETFYGRAAPPLPTRWTYGSSPRHMVDRFPVAEAALATPFLRIERVAPPDADTGQAPRQTAIEVYRASLDGDATLDARKAGALLWLPVGALRQVAGGAPLSDLLAMEDMRVELPLGARLPDDALIYLPSEYGERFLLRIAAKYGEGALFAASSLGT
ncbi:MAG TPA: hypothetical protein VFN78_08880 [Ktedonobacterales bacterium]|nr:hypothetical protein [Ktedonobacterales bacterium]